jgi:hypothetical protein
MHPRCSGDCLGILERTSAFFVRYSMVEMYDLRAEEQGRHEGTHRENIEEARCVIILSYSWRYMYSSITALACLLRHCMIKSARKRMRDKVSKKVENHTLHLTLFISSNANTAKRTNQTKVHQLMLKEKWREARA